MPGRLVVIPALAVVLAAASAACGADDAQSLATLPPIRTTTTSSTTTTLFDERTRIYTVKEGDNLSRIANSFEVPLSFLIDANADAIDDPDNVPPGVVLEIPPYVVVDELPQPTVTTEAP